ncbi:hypothetical protein GE061_010779 [Apolygus lucorum]|uniref:BESS domain-containing protein n=1 Tax=Apolygus lucorum TaxID=248454 RepID=A0A6A4INY5_APOLU|nr:hypothetical protein GE061_010779 [Apolygus lucorum]
MDESAELLIESVEARPALYNKALKDYANANIKKILWEEVCEQVVPNWSALHGEERSKVGLDIPKKWLNLRSCFSRELRQQKTHKSGKGAKKRRKYIYFDKLLFLLPSIEDKQTTSTLDPQDEVSDHEKIGGPPPVETLSTGRPPKRKTPEPKNQNDDFQNSLLNLLREKKSLDDDEDVLFALSLVPTMKSLDDFTKFDLKLKIMELLKSAKWPQHVRQHPHTSAAAGQQLIHQSCCEGNLSFQRTGSVVQSN